jgi:hypothetical protein
MNRKASISVVVIFFLSYLLGYVVHGVLLRGDYAALGAMFRPEEQQMAYMLWMTLAHVSLAIGFVWVYLKGREEAPFLGQGIRYGLAISVLMVVPMYLIYYSVQPMPGMVVAKQIGYDGICTVIMGIVVAWLNR